MVRILVFGFLVLVGTSSWGQEHQRVAAASPRTHQFEVGVDCSFCPFGYGLWEGTLGPRAGYEFQKTWAVAAALSHSWRSDPDLRTVVGTWGSGTLGASWSGGPSDQRWRLGAEAAFPIDPEVGPAGRSLSVDFGAHWVRDPVIQGFSVGVNFPNQPETYSGQATWFFQEVVNDSLTWSLVLSPRCTWFEGLPLWSLTVSWKVGWYDGPSSLASGISTGSGAPWTWATSGSRSWELP